MTYYGDIHLGDTLDFAFVTTSASTGAPTTLSGAPVLSCYVGSSTTELTAGITLTVDFDTRTGYNHVTIVASSGNGYTTATNVNVVITTGTVGGTSAVGYVVGSFSIDKRGVNQILGTAVSTPATAGVLDVNAKNINNVATTSVTTISANQGTTQPLNFTGTASSALVKSDMVDVAGAAVSTSSAQIGVNAVNIGGTAQTGRDIGASVLLSSGTGTGQLDFTSGVVKANLAQILGTALTETAGQIAAAFKQFFNIASPTSTMNVITTTTTATNLTNAATAGDFTATMKTSIGTAVAASAVASVTGNVGGNIVGSVASVTARVTANTDQLAGQTVTAAAGVTFPSSVASPTNITAGTITTATNVTNGVTLAAAAIDSASLATSGKAAIADSLLDRDMSTGTDSGTEIIRTPRQALRVLRNKVDIPNGKVKKEDDATDSWTFAVTTAAGNPVVTVDPT